jgi:hypothetical protein
MSRSPENEAAAARLTAIANRGKIESSPDRQAQTLAETPENAPPSESFQ